MEYQVTATRLRPQKFEDLLGQEFVAATLQKSIEAGKIAHAYLFSGPRGCGKTSSARILAKVINCVEAPKLAPCGKCTSCEEITAGSCLDVIEIDGASNTSVNDVRQIKDEILFPPNSNRYKVYIIDEVHMLSTSAFNALLKTIEEPPPYVVFIFATTEIHKVPATIKSRCQQFNFKLVPVEILKEALNKACGSLDIKADEEALYWIAREATGSVRDAYTLFDQVAAFSDGHITFEKIHEKLGLTGIESINNLVLACVQKNAKQALSVVDEILQNGISVEQIVLDCADYFRSLLLIKNGIRKEALIGQSAKRFPAEILNTWDSIQIEQALSIMLQLFKDLRFSIDPRFELELAVSRLAWLVDFVSPSDLKKAFESAKNLLAGGSQISSKNNSKSSMNSNFGNMTSQQSNYNKAYQESDQSFSEAGSLTDHVKTVLRNKANMDEKSSFGETVQTTRSNDVLQNDSEQIKPNSEAKSETALEDKSGFVDESVATESFYMENKQKLTGRVDIFKIMLEKNLEKENALLAVAVSRTKDWLVEDNHITMFVDANNFDLSLLQKQISVVKKAITAMLGEPFKISIKDKSGTEIEEVVEEKGEPPFIDLLLDTFNGKIVRKSLLEVDSSEDTEEL